MQPFALKISALSLVLLSNTISFSMLTIHNTEQFNIQKFSEDIRRHIFVVACPSIKNQLKNSCKSWHKIGTKQAPNMYQLINDESFHPSQDDWSYVMMHAAWNENIEVMSNILNRTNQRNFDYDISEETSFRLSDMFVIQKLHLGNNNWKKGTPKKFEELDLASNAHKNGVVFFPLFMACFDGDSDKVKQELDVVVDGKVVEYSNDRLKYSVSEKVDNVEMHRLCTTYALILDCFYIAMYNDNPHCIKVLSFLKNKKEPNQEIHLELLFMAMKKQKKQAFKALVQNNVYGCLKNVHLGRAYGGINTTTLDEICKQTDIPNIAEYIALYKELGGKTLQEMGYDEDEDYNDFSHPFSVSTEACNLQ